MRRSILCLLLLMALLLTGCGQSASAPAPEAPEVPVTEAPTTVPTEPLCAHQWSEATFTAPSTCQLCGEIQGEPKQSFFQEHGLNADIAYDWTLETVNELGEPTTVSSCTFELEGLLNSLTLDRTEPAMGEVTFGGWHVRPPRQGSGSRTVDYGVEEGYQEIRFNLHIERYGKKCADGTVLDQCDFNYGLYDYYTGQWLHPAYAPHGGEDQVVYELEIDGVTYTIEYSNTFESVTYKSETLEDGSTLVHAYLTEEYKIKVPFEYDGLVLGFMPYRDNRGTNRTEDGEFVTVLSEEASFEEGTYFRLNGLNAP